MQAFKTVTKTQTQQVESVHYTEAHKVLENAQKQVADLCLDYDSTGSSYYVNATKILANLTETYYCYCDDDEYISVAEIIHAIADCLTYYDDKHLYDNCVANTALAKINLYDYAHLSN
jgi:hypothetical protein